MPVDNSMYSMIKPPDIAGGIEQGMRMRDMITQRDRQAKADSQNDQKFQMEKQRNDIDLISRIAPTVKDQASYSAALQHLGQSGVDVKDMPETYDPALVERYSSMALSAKEKLDQQFRQQQLESQAEDRKESRAQRYHLAGMAHQDRQDKLNLQQQEKADKKKAQMFEVEDRVGQINSAINELDSMIEEDGTFEMFGSHNQDLDRKVTQIATDMAKLMDPQSVARDSEVETIKKTLIQSGFQNRNGTAQDLLRNFKNEVARRAESAYKVRGLEKPQQMASPGQKTIESVSKFPAIDYNKLSDDELTLMYNEKIKGQKNAKSR